MLALASVPQSQSPALVIIVIAAVIVAAFWRTILKIGIAAMIIRFVFLLVTVFLDVIHAVRARAVARPAAPPITLIFGQKLLPLAYDESSWSRTG